MMLVTTQQIREIAAEAICDLRTVRAAYAGRRIRNSSWLRVRRAAAQLGLPLPPSQKSEVA